MKISISIPAWLILISLLLPLGSIQWQELQLYYHKYLGGRESLERSDAVEKTYSAFCFRPESNEIVWHKADKEFMYAGKMYDIVESCLVDGFLHGICYEDKKENRLYRKLAKSMGKQAAKDPMNSNGLMLCQSLLLKFFPQVLQRSILTGDECYSNDRFGPSMQLHHQWQSRPETPPPVC